MFDLVRLEVARCRPRDLPRHESRAPLHELSDELAVPGLNGYFSREHLCLPSLLLHQFQLLGRQRTIAIEIEVVRLQPSRKTRSAPSAFLGSGMGDLPHGS